ncbi:carboxypeptidase regulatory-like domain-containing protein [Xanthomonas sp. XNM01]|uniref:TonB-dependent receptor n=1 Tax=Xanthomonas sp. XNM01 TaxID=2769289 RepID=UPI00177C9658|nr:carboxypeptidase regulatory-like domain-containing protein [Xanthomonas sp. XNM01]MBD9367536.1 TonB-dependent receptor [Xanthomonas sp. XNM01]
MSKLTLGLVAALAAAPAFAQSTSAGVGGTVLSNSGQPVVGAEVVITHTESGTVSRATTDAAGRYNARGLRVGGPYTITITKPGEGTKTEEGVYLTLAQTATVNAALTGDIATLETVTAVGFAGGSEVFSATKMGAGTSVDRQTIEALPSAGGNIQDYIRLDPRIAQTNKAEGTISAGGQNPRYNAIRVDGVSVSDTFGLEANNLPTQRQPVAMEALEAINVDLSSYDVTITGATGAVVDVVTKSGTNEFHGSVYGMYRDGDWFGDDPTGKVFNGFEKEQTYGVTFGGPLVKDKLFFFANYEKQEWKAPGASLADSALGTGAISQAQVDEAIRLAQSEHGIDIGGTGNVDGSTTLEEYAFKVDWNITDNHRASLRYSKVEQSQLRTPNTSGTIISLSSSYYQQEKTIENYVAQLFSDWSDIFSTELKASYRDYASTRVTPYDLANVRIYFDGTVDAPTGAYIQFGPDISTPMNALATKTKTAYGAGVLTLGNHDIKFGADYSTNEVYNMFNQYLYGAYSFYGLDNFANGYWSNYQLNMPRVGLEYNDIAGNFEYQELGFFIQDTWYVNNNLTLNFGLRADKPDVKGAPVFNATAQQAFGFDNSNVLGKDEYLIQPRFGFNYTFDSDRPTQLRGGIGLFRGVSPQVWISNAFSNTGAALSAYGQYGIEDDVNPGNYPYEPIGSGQVRPGGSTNNGAMTVNMVSPDFEQPSIWKANLAFDHELPWYGIVASAELLLTKNKTGLVYKHLNIGESLVTGQDGREIYYNPNRVGRSWTTATNRYNRDTRFEQVYLLDNEDGGKSQQFTVALQRPWMEGSDWSWNVGYTYTNADQISDMTSSTANSTWRYNYNFQANAAEIGTSRYEIKDRLTASLNWRHAFFGDYKTSVGVFYEGRTGRPYSFVFRNDANGDSYSFNDLFYVPSGPGDVLFGSLSSAGVFTADPAMEQAFFDYLERNPELGRYAGGVTPRNGARGEWINSFDVRISQELPGFFKGHKSEIWLDVMNVGNLINKDWGHIYDYGFFANKGIASAVGMYQGKYVYSFNEASIDRPAVQNTRDSIDQGVSQWSLQLGFRYKF